MKSPDDITRLGHIYDAIIRIESYVRGIKKNAFLENSMMQDAVMRQIEIIGEASRHISDEFEESHPNIPWFEMRGIRNKIVHDYLEINNDVIWDTVKNDLPVLKKQIERMLKI
jgi:uncharacterized protein with HEPN domain